jgi:hypothetical protein
VQLLMFILVLCTAILLLLQAALRFGWAEKRRRLKAAVGRVVAVLALAWAICAGFGLVRVRDHVRSFGDAAWSVMFGFEDATEWAPGFDEARFDSVRVGMSEGQVFALLGHPLDEWRFDHGDRVLRYTVCRRDPTNYWRRHVVLGPSGRVTEVIGELWVD